MKGMRTDPGKANIPGWKIEPSYRPGVLMGNWNEETRNFVKGDYQHNTTHRTDFLNYGSVQPDIVLRRRGELMNEGLPAKLLLHHHGNKYISNLVTWYDEDYNGRWREKNLPPLRSFDRHKLAWVPEKSDIHVQEPPTNFGLLPVMQKTWAAQLADREMGDYLTTYSLSYSPKRLIPAQVRCAQPVFESTTLHPVNKTLKDLHLRNVALQKHPEQMPAEMTYVSV